MAGKNWSFRSKKAVKLLMVATAVCRSFEGRGDAASMMLANKPEPKSIDNVASTTSSSEIVSARAFRQKRTASRWNQA